MNSDLEKRIMKRVYYLSIYKSFRTRVPLKVLLLAITLSLSTRVISYKTIYNYFINLEVKNTFNYAFWSVVHAPIIKLAILSVVILLIISVLRDLIKNGIKKGIGVRE